jgi:hypothetical protein
MKRDMDSDSIGCVAPSEISATGRPGTCRDLDKQHPGKHETPKLAHGGSAGNPENLSFPNHLRYLDAPDSPPMQSSSYAGQVLSL